MTRQIAHNTKKARPIMPARHAITPIFHHGKRINPFFARDMAKWKFWLANSRRGDWCCYWEGNLMLSREGPPLRLSPDLAIRVQERAEAIGEAAWRSYKNRRTTLVQGVHPLMGKRYFAVKL